VGSHRVNQKENEVTIFKEKKRLWSWWNKNTERVLYLRYFYCNLIARGARPTDPLRLTKGFDKQGNATEKDLQTHVLNQNGHFFVTKNSRYFSVRKIKGVIFVGVTNWPQNTDFSSKNNSYSGHLHCNVIAHSYCETTKRTHLFFKGKKRILQWQYNYPTQTLNAFYKYKKKHSEKVLRKKRFLKKSLRRKNIVSGKKPRWFSLFSFEKQ